MPNLFSFLRLCLIVVGDQAYHCCVVCKLNDGVGVIPGLQAKIKAVSRSIKKWSDEADAKLQDCFIITDSMTLRNTPHQSLALSISAPRTSFPQ
jgi:hypothetical protein